MITAVDTNVILDVLISGEPLGASSKRLLDRHLSEGTLILSEVVLAELSAHFPTERELKSFLTETGMRLVYQRGSRRPLTRQSRVSLPLSLAVRAK